MAQPIDHISNPCAALEEDLVLLHYGDLSGTELSALQAHVPSCSDCSAYLAELGKLLPSTVKTDEPPQSFWTDYNRELRLKLDGASDQKSWVERIRELLQIRWVPVLATAAIIALALTFTIGKGLWPSKNIAPEDEAFMEVLPVAENLDFFKAMDVLDDLDLLEFLSSQSNNNA
ncbi:MAG: hypothetical protein ACREQO_19865 [Candidatus Binatia bacterium]